jgi:hypothetical protein
MTVSELIAALRGMPESATTVTDSDELEIIGVHPSPDAAIVVLWSEPK